jgi:hypothetical protein
MNIRYNDRAAIWIGLLIGIVSFLAYFGIDRATGEGPAYRWPAGDQAQHIAGAYAYLDGDWSFPIFNTDRINYPAGVNIIFTDSAPFAGFIAKIFYSLSGIRFNYLGAWFAVLWIGQAAAGSYLMRQLAPKRPVLHICGALIALAWPAFLNRYFHLALSSHFLLLFALGLYFATTRERHSWMRLVCWCLVLGVAIWTHVYLFLMSFALFAAATADAIVRKRETAKEGAISCFVALVWCISLALIGGYQTAGGVNAEGYGSFRMDLLAYFWPHGSAILKAPVIFDPAVAFEGFNFLGIGGLIIVAIALMLLRQKHFSSLVRRPWLVACIMGMTFFSITNYVSFAGTPIFQYPLPIERFPFATFRASGRFGWPLGYLAVFAGLALIENRLSQNYQRLAVALVCGLTALQVADARILLQNVRGSWVAPARPAIEEAIRRSDNVDFDPPIDCIREDKKQKEAIEVSSLAAREGKRTNSAHIARSGSIKCEAQPHIPTQNDLVITMPDTAAGNFYRQTMDCSQYGSQLFCMPRNVQGNAAIN